MLNEPKNRISDKALSVWRIRGLIQVAVTIIIYIILSILILVFDFPKWIIFIFVALLFLDLYFAVFFNPKLRWRRWRYEVREQEIELQHGLFVVTRTLVPMVRVQHVDTVQGPILKKYQLATVEISTAATVHEIPALDEKEAEEIRRKISVLARVADEDV